MSTTQPSHRQTTPCVGGEAPRRTRARAPLAALAVLKPAGQAVRAAAPARIAATAHERLAEARAEAAEARESAWVTVGASAAVLLPRAWGLQFHPEVLSDAIADWAGSDGAIASVRDAEPRLREVWGTMAEAWGAVVLAGAGADGVRVPVPARTARD